MATSLNQILYGVPGTGKTYNTVNMALDILEPLPSGSWASQSRTTAKQKFDEYKAKGQIVFTTFHQSMTYEDFIEGIKSEIVNGAINYACKDGIFKKLCKKAMVTAQTIAQEYDLLVADILNGNITTIPLPSGKPSLPMGVTSKGNIYFERNNGTQGDVTSKDKIISMYEEEPDYEKSKKHDYGHKGNDTNHGAVLDDLWKKLRSKKFVLIIDEINRGNVANIFGELITLIEEDKRLGNENAMTTVLPTSKENFGVPNNIHIIGTMNTADRSIVMLDSALRRRFNFVEMKPNPSLLKTTSDGIDLAKFLTVINQRIATLKGREYQIGHSYFMKVNNKHELLDVIYRNVIPLLQEYFYGNYQNMQLVLGNVLIQEEQQTVTFAANYDDYDDEPVYVIADKDTIDVDKALAAINF